MVEGAVQLPGRAWTVGHLLVLRLGTAPTLHATTSCALISGGARLDGPRYVWWNFVSSSRERIEQAKEEPSGRFVPVPGETDFIPLPEDGGTAVT